MMESAESKTFFQRISAGQETEQLLGKVELNHLSLVCRLEPAPHTLVTLKVLKFKDSIAQCELVDGKSANGVYDAIVTFEYEHDNYFLQGKVTCAGNHWSVDFTQPIFRVHRRDSFRVNPPADYPVKIKLIKGAQKIESLVKDISIGGCNVHLPKKDSDLLRENDEIEIALLFPDKPVFSCKVQIRAKRPIKDSDEFQFGLKFLNLKSGQENQVSQSVMAVHRHVFSRIK